jgi:drug/metabolite transporter (DMT)-like permease
MNYTSTATFILTGEAPLPPPIIDEPSIGYTKSFWIGLGVSVFTNLVQAFALSFQRKSHLLNDTIYPHEQRKSAWKRPMWLFAFLSFLTANTIGSIFSIGYLPIVILAPIGAMNLVFNAFAANIVLGDPLSKQSILGIYFLLFVLFVCCKKSN